MADFSIPAAVWKQGNADLNVYSAKARGLPGSLPKQNAQVNPFDALQRRYPTRLQPNQEQNKGQ